MTDWTVERILDAMILFTAVVFVTLAYSFLSDVYADLTARDWTPAEVQTFFQQRFEEMRLKYETQPPSCVMCSDWQELG